MIKIKKHLLSVLAITSLAFSLPATSCTFNNKSIDKDIPGKGGNDTHPLTVAINFSVLDGDTETTLSGNISVHVNWGMPFFTVSKPTAYKIGYTCDYWMIKSGDSYERLPETHQLKADTTVYPHMVPASLNNGFYSITDDNNIILWDAKTLCSSDASTKIEGTDFVSHLAVNPIERTSFNYNIFVGPKLTEIPDNFLNGCTAFSETIKFQSSVVKIGSNFLKGCTNFNQVLNLPQNLTSIGEGFLSGCTSFNQNLQLPSNVKAIANDFMLGCSAFNSTLGLSLYTTSIGNNFLSNCIAFDTSIEYFNTDKLESVDYITIGDNFLKGCILYNQDLTFNKIGKVGSNFMSGCVAFNQSLTIPATLTSIGDGFLYNCNQMGSPIKFTNPVSAYTKDGDIGTTYATDTATASIYKLGVNLTGPDEDTLKAFIAKFPPNDTTPYRKYLDNLTHNYFGVEKGATQAEDKWYYLDDDTLFDSSKAIKATSMDSAGNPTTEIARDKFNLKVVVSNKVTEIPNNFLINCTALTLTPVFYGSLTKIGNNFMSGCTSYVGATYLGIPESCLTIGDYFLSGCTKFNYQIKLNKQTTLGSYFLSGCTSFNSNIEFGSALTKIGAYFLNGCTAYNQKMIVPSTLVAENAIGEAFMLDCQNFTETFYVNNAATVFASSDLTLATHSSTAAVYTHGISIQGTGAADFITKFPASTTNPPYRKYADFELGYWGHDGNEIIYYDVTSLCNGYQKAGSANITGCYKSDKSKKFSWDRNTFNHDVHVDSTVTEIPSYFLCNCPAFNKDINMGTCKFTKVGDWFLADSPQFSNNLTFPASCTEIGDYFMHLENYSVEPFNYNKTLNLQHIKKIGKEFASGSRNFNSPINFGEPLEEIGDWFLAGCYKFDCEIVLHSNVKKIGTGFLYDARLFRNTVYIDSTSISWDSSTPNAISCSIEDCDSVKSGFVINSHLSNAKDIIAAFKSTFPESHTGSYHRHYRQ